MAIREVCYGMKQISVMIKPASSLCNMRCKYCFYADVSSLRTIRSYGMMDKETAEKLIGNVLSFVGLGDKVCFSFQGGEPTLAGLVFFRFFTDEAKNQASKVGVVLDFALQTNGVLIDKDWCIFLRQHDYLVGLSLDGWAKCHDMNRPDAAGKGTYKRVMEAKELMDDIGVEYNVLTTLTNSLARHPQQVWNFVKEKKIKHLQLTPCLDDMNADKRSVYALTPRRFSSFYKVLFSLWYKDWVKGEYTSIKLFDDIINLLTDGMQSACGILGRCHPQVVVEADGSAYPCDFYMLDEYRMGSLRDEKLGEILRAQAVEKFLGRDNQIPKLCEDCKFRGICGGNCKRMRKNVCCASEDSYCGYADFLSSTIGDMLSIASSLADEKMRGRRK